MKKIRVIIKRPGYPPYTTWISNTLENLQRTVGGYIEAVTIRRGVVVICDEEGRLKGYPYNCTVNGISFVGDIIIAGVDGDEITSLLFNNYELRRLCPGLWPDSENVNRCVCCGEIIPEGRQVCPTCEAKASVNDEFGFKKYGIHHAYPKHIINYIDTDIISGGKK